MDMQVQEQMDMTRPLAGRVAIVTGSTSGIGLGIARALAESGADVVINGLGEPNADRTRPRRARAGLSREPHRLQWREPDERRGSRAAWSSKPLPGSARVDILVNNAGIQHVSPIEVFPPEKYEAIIALNLSAAWYTTRAAFAG